VIKVLFCLLSLTVQAEVLIGNFSSLAFIVLLNLHELEIWCLSMVKGSIADVVFTNKPTRPRKKLYGRICPKHFYFLYDYHSSQIRVYRGTIMLKRYDF
jgi:hypothetical protein